jgi:signal transduction histidine kinase
MDASKPLEPLSEARKTTDDRLASERRQADRELSARGKRSESTTDAKIAKKRREADARLEAAKEEAHEVVEPDSEGAQLRRTAEARKDAVANGADSARSAVEATAKDGERALAKEKEKAKRAVDHVKQQAEGAAESERRTVDQLTDDERLKRKRDFLEVLAAERRKTDNALELERDSSDASVANRDNVLAIISHDLRNYLNVIAMKTATLKSAAATDPQRFDTLISSIHTACETMARWANDLVDLSSIEANEIRLEPHVCEPRDLVGRAVEAFKSLASAREIVLETDTPERHTTIFGDPDRLAQVLLNLLDNATKFVARGGHIRIGFRENGAGVATFFVSDTGPGIGEADVERIFDRFWHAAKGKAGGTGLGLYISRRIIEAHGGKIWVENDPGRGATFSFTVPMCSAAPQ